MNNTPLILSVVGHTNVGKTSLLRTLTRDMHFGEISDRPSTTRHVEGARLSVKGKALVELYDTPGLEDAISLLEYLEQIVRPQERLDGPARLERFLNGPEAKGRFEQEAKVLRQLLLSDAGLYVIDVREPILDKYRDELDILNDCGKPLLPVLNFVNHPASREDEWKNMLSRLGLHALVRFDTVSPPLDGETRLYENLSLLISDAKPRLDTLISDLENQKKERHKSAMRLIAEALIDVAAYARSVASEDEKSAMIEQLHHDIRAYEQKTITSLLTLYRFNKDAALTDEIPLLEGRFEDDLFSAEALKEMGLKLGKGVATGAAAGAAIDLAVGGLTLGAATALGALVGGLSQSVRHYGSQLLGKFNGEYKISVDDAILRLLALRLQMLQSALEIRGHAAQNAVIVSDPQDDIWRNGKLPPPLEVARAHPNWSSMNPGKKLHDTQRLEEIETLTNFLLLPSGKSR